MIPARPWSGLPSRDSHHQEPGAKTGREKEGNGGDTGIEMVLKVTL